MLFLHYVFHSSQYRFTLVLGIFVHERMGEHVAEIFPRLQCLTSAEELGQRAPPYSRAL